MNSDLFREYLQYYNAGWWAAANHEEYDEEQNGAWKNGYEDFMEILGDTYEQKTIL